MSWQWEFLWVIPVGLLLLALLGWTRAGRDELVAAGSTGLAAASHRSRWFRTIWRTETLWFAALAVSLVALANPRHGETLIQNDRNGIAIMNVVDTSKSMEALDFSSQSEPLTRMAGAVQILRDFVQRRTSDQLGLIVFGDEVFTLAPLTGDVDLILNYLGQVQAGMAGQSTALGDAMAIAVKRLRDVPMKSRVMIALTDGENTAGALQPMEAARLAVDAGIKIYTIGVGTNGQAPYRVRTLFGEEIQMLPVSMDEKTLRNVAELTGGKYFAANSRQELDEVYRRIDELEKTTFKAETTVRYEDRYLPWLAAAIACMLAATFWSVVLRRRFPL